MIKNDEIIFNNNYEIKLYSYIEEHNEYEFEFYLDQLTTEMMLEVHILVAKGLLSFTSIFWDNLACRAAGWAQRVILSRLDDGTLF
jgi:hypothetical protein